MRFATALGILVACSFVNAEVEYMRSGTCKFTEECVYKYDVHQYMFGENDREELKLSTDVHWHCESSGTFGDQSAEEHCFTLSKTLVSASADFDKDFKVNYTTDAERDAAIATFLGKELKGEFCYVQTSDGKIVSVHYAPTLSYDGVNIKRGIASAFQGYFDSKDDMDIEEFDSGSIHTSHYTFTRQSNGMTDFKRKFTNEDMKSTAGDVPENSMVYAKEEDSEFEGKVLTRSHGRLTTKVDLGHNKEDNDDEATKPPSDTYNPNIHFDKEFEANGTYTIEKSYCKKRSRRSLIFSDLSGPNVVKGNLMAIIDLSKHDKYRIRKIREAMPSIPKLLESLRRQPNNTDIVDTLQQLLNLEAQHGTAPGYSPAINDLIEYYKKVKFSDRPEDKEIKQLMYVFLAADGSLQSQKILGSRLGESMSETEKGILLHQLTQISKAGPELVNTVIDMNAGNDDNILLVLGALARNNNEGIQNIVVNELLQRLDNIKSSPNNTESIIFLTYAIGNTGSKSVIATLLSSLEHTDTEVQISAIRSLGVHLNQEEVQSAFTDILATTSDDELIKEIVTLFMEAYDSKVLTNPDNTILNATVQAALRVADPNLYELLLKYLEKIETDEAISYAHLIILVEDYGQAQHDVMSSLFSGSRIKRGSDWDQSSSSYDVVSSYSQRRSDVVTYPYHKAYIWGKTLGVDKLNLQVGAGAFGGVRCASNNNGFKVFVRAVAKVNVFSRSYYIADMHYSDYTSGNYLYHKVYVRLGSTVHANINQRYYTCFSATRPLWQTREYTVFNVRFGIWLYVGTLNVYIRGTVSSRADANACGCVSTTVACADVKPSVTLRVTGGASASLLYLVQGGLEVSATFTYYVQPNLCLQATCNHRTIRARLCLQLHHGYPASVVSIYPWYQYRTLTWRGFIWGERIRWDALSRSWNLSSASKRLLWSSCSSPVQPCRA